MGNPVLRTPFGTIELQPAAPRSGSPEGARVYILLPDLDELLGVPGFGLRNPIRIPQTALLKRLPVPPRDRETSLH